MYLSVGFEICIGLIFMGLGVFLWYFFKSIEVQLRAIQESLQLIHDDLWKFQRNLGIPKRNWESEVIEAQEKWKAGIDATGPRPLSEKEITYHDDTKQRKRLAQTKIRPGR